MDNGSLGRYMYRYKLTQYNAILFDGLRLCSLLICVPLRLFSPETNRIVAQRKKLWAVPEFQKSSGVARQSGLAFFSESVAAHR